MTFNNLIKIVPFLFIFAFSSFAILPFLKIGFYEANDAIWHIVRIYQFHLSLSSGQFPPRWAPTLLNGMGSPAFVANYQLPYYLSEIFNLLGLNLIQSYKAVLALTIPLSGLFMFMFLGRIFPTLASLAGSIFFMYSPYRFATIFSRGAIGEALAICITPLVFLFIHEYSQNKKIKDLLFHLQSSH